MMIKLTKKRHTKKQGIKNGDHSNLISMTKQNNLL